MARLPTVGGDYGNWGTVLNDYLGQAHKADGTLKADVQTIADLKALDVTTFPDKSQALVAGYYAPGDQGGGAFYYDAGASDADNGGTVIAPDAGAGRWMRITSSFLTPEMFGAKGDGTTDDTSSVQAAFDTADGEVCVMLTRLYPVSTVIAKSSIVVDGIGPTSGLKALSAAPVITSTLANRTVAASVEGLRLSSFSIDGNSIATHGVYLQRFTRGCSINDVYIHDVNGDGILLDDCWSYSLSRCRVKGCAQIGIKMVNANNAFHVSACHITTCGIGAYVENAQGAIIVGNTFEYNKTSNLDIAGLSLVVDGNYIEGIDSSTTDLGGSAYQVTLGSASVPFKRSHFNNYINGGSVGGTGFSGDGVKLFNVVECSLGCSFSASTRYEWAYDESWTLIGNAISVSFDNNPAFIRNLTAGASGGIETLSGSNCRLNSGVRSGDAYGIRHDYQTSAVSGGNVCHFRIIGGGSVLFDFGKITSTDGIFKFDASGDGYYSFEKPMKIPVFTTTTRDGIATPKNGMLILNTTTGKYQGYKEATSSWVDFN